MVPSPGLGFRVRGASGKDLLDKRLLVDSGCATPHAQKTKALSEESTGKGLGFGIQGFRPVSLMENILELGMSNFQYSPSAS